MTPLVVRTGINQPNKLENKRDNIGKEEIQHNNEKNKGADYKGEDWVGLDNLYFQQVNSGQFCSLKMYGNITLKAHIAEIINSYLT